MKKSDIIKMLEPFEDDDNIMFDDVVGLYDPKRICGKGQFAMPYTCVLEPGHEGQCWCKCKNIEFTPD